MQDGQLRQLFLLLPAIILRLSDHPSMVHRIIGTARRVSHGAVTDRMPRCTAAMAQSTGACQMRSPHACAGTRDSGYMRPAAPVAAPLLVLLSTALLPSERMAPPLTALNPMSFAVTIEEPMKTCTPAPLARMPAPPLRLDDERWISRLTAAPPAAVTPMMPKLPLALTRVSCMLAKTTPPPAPDARKPSKFRFSWTRCRVTRALPAPGSTKMPPAPEELLPLNEMTLSLTKSWAAPLGTNSMPALLNCLMVHPSTVREAPWENRIPLSPVPRPSMVSPRRTT